MNNKWNIIFYKWEDWNIKINVIFEGETIWLSQKQIWEVFWTTKQNISLHLQNCFESWEISEKATVKNFLTVQKEWNREVKRDVNFYNLDAILSVW